MTDVTLYTDHSALATMSQAVSQTAGLRVGTGIAPVRSFWASPERLPDDPAREVLEVSLIVPQLLNWITFDVARYTSQVYVEYLEPGTSTWLPLLDATGNPLARSIFKSVPQRIPQPSTIPVGLHPQHSFIGHWETISVPLTPVSAQLLRVVLYRIDSPDSPVNVFGNPATYSLAVRGLALGYQISDLSQVPRTLPTGEDADATRQPFATSNDPLGSALNFSLRQLDASRVISDVESDSIWRSETQPSANAVVSLYADLRAADGTGQVVDRIFLDPINTGAHVTVYYSNDTLTGDFDSPVEPLSPSVVVTTPNVQMDPNSGLVLAPLDDVPQALGIQNGALGYDPSQPWWTGLVFTPQLDPATLNSPAPILDCGTWQLALTADGLQASFANNDVLVLEFPCIGGLPTTAVLGYDGQNYLLTAQNSITQATATGVASSPLTLASLGQLVLGADQARANFGQSDLQWLVVKQETLGDGGQGYLLAPSAYSTVASFAEDEPVTSSTNAVLRFDPTTVLTSERYPYGLFGGTPARYESLLWSVISRDYTMQRGWLELPSVRAKFFKLEFTHLQADLHDVYIPVSQLVRYFPNSVLADYQARLAANVRTDVSGDVPHTQVSRSVAYSDTPTIVSTGGTGTGYTNSEVYVVEDYTIAQRLIDTKGSAWNYQQWQTPQTAPRFPGTQRHRYRVELATRTAKIGYVVGLRGLRFARNDPSAQYDTPEYLENFYDDAGVDYTISNWTFDPDLDGMTSGDTNYAVLQSRAYSSRRDVRAVQFAAQQSPPTQLLLDPDFTSPIHANWSPVGDAVFGDEIASTTYESLQQVKRHSTLPLPSNWGTIGVDYSTYGGVEAAGGSYQTLTTSYGPSGAVGGGVVSDPVPMPNGGYLYAAARVVCAAALSAPVWVQIYDTIDNRVLAEEPLTVAQNQYGETYTGCPIGVTLLPVDQRQGPETWGDVSGGDVERLQTYQDSFARANSTLLGAMTTGQQWGVQVGTQSLQIVSNLAQVTAAGQSAGVDTGTPWGTLLVQLGTAVTTATETASVPLIDLDGAVLMNDGRLVDDNTGRLLLTVTSLANNDLLEFDVIPTAQLAPADLPSPAPDATVQSWSLVVRHNGTRVGTVSRTRAFGTTKFLLGAVGQQFASFGWTPNRSRIDYRRIPRMPMPTDGTLSGDQLTWTDSSGRIWNVSGTPTFTTGSSYLAAPNTMTAPAGQSVGVATQLPSLEGALNFSWTGGNSAPSQYYVALLDVRTSGDQLYLRADGAVVQVSASDGSLTVLQSGVTTLAGETAILIVAPSRLSSTFLSTYGVGANAQQVVVFLTNGTVSGVYSDTIAFTSPNRALMAYDGSAITGFGWSVDVGLLATAATGVQTWDMVDGGLTREWSDIVYQRLPSTTDVQAAPHPVAARLIQKAPTNDVFYLDSIVLYHDPLVWEFSADGGANWVPGNDVRNNTQGAVMFAPTQLTGQPATQLMYRVTAWAPNTWISHLALRPWYKGYARGVSAKPPSPVGPNLNPRDEYLPIEQDPHFQVWDLPIPREWWFAFRKLGQAQFKQRYPMVTERILE